MISQNSGIYLSKGPSKVFNIFPYKQNSYNFLTPNVMTNINIFVFGPFCMWNQFKCTDFSYIRVMIIKNKT